MSSLPTISVVMPTYNRKAFLYQALASLARQEWPASPFEVIVVDDGSDDGTAAVAHEVFPFTLRYIYQTNQGDAPARNTGAQQSQADVLIFMDDDIVASQDYLRYLAAEHMGASNRIVVGTEHLWLEESLPPAAEPLASSMRASFSMRTSFTDTVEIPFAEVCSNNMSIRREAYLSLGMMHNLGFSGSSIWCDVDFCFRAYQQGFEFRRSTGAVCWHRDHVSQNLDSRTRRMREAGYRAAVLFQKYPDLIPYVPMFEDKTAIAWGQDKPAIIARKLARPVTSSGPWLWGMRQLFAALESAHLLPGLRQAISRWIIGGRIYQGYRAGVREFQNVGRGTLRLRSGQAVKRKRGEWRINESNES